MKLTTEEKKWVKRQFFKWMKEKAAREIKPRIIITTEKLPLEEPKTFAQGAPIWLHWLFGFVIGFFFMGVIMTIWG
jgi:hypothetical protein